MVSVVIIDYKSWERTIKFIDDFNSMVSLEGAINFVIVDNSQELLNFEQLTKWAAKASAPTNAYDVTNRLRKTGGEQLGRVEKALVAELARGRLLIVKSAENGGFAKGNNTGAAAAKELFDDEYIVFSNNDILFPEQLSLEKLISPIKNKGDVAVSGPRIVGIDGKRQSPYKKLDIWRMHIIPYVLWPVMIPINRLFRKENVFTDLDKRERSGYVYRVMGSFMVVSSESFFKAGMFDENTFLYGEEMILSERLESIAGRTFYVDECTIVHEHGATTEKSFKYIKTQRIKLDSSLYYYEKYIGASKFELALARAGFAIYEKLYFPLKNIVRGRP